MIPMKIEKCLQKCPRNMIILNLNHITISYNVKYDSFFSISGKFLSGSWMFKKVILAEVIHGKLSM